MGISGNAGVEGKGRKPWFFSNSVLEMVALIGDKDTVTFSSVITEC